AGHILVSKHAAEDLEQYDQWQPYLHDIGQVEIKHGERLHLVNFYDEEIGNPAVPNKLGRSGVETIVAAAKKSRITRRRVAIAVLIMAAFAIAFLTWRIVGTDRRPLQRSTTEGQPSGASLPIPEKSIAVLPFENLSSDKENAYLADGIQ